MAKRGRPSAKLGEIGFSGLRHAGGFVKEDFITKLQGPLGQKRLREMADNDATIGGILFAMESIIMQAGWQVVRGGSTSLDNECAQFVRSCMLDCSHTWEDFISGILTFLKFGWAYFEIVYKMRSGDASDPRYKSKFEDGRMGWRKFGFRAQETLFKWEFDPAGGIKGLWQMANFYAPGQHLFTPTFIPIEKSILFRTKQEKNNPEGRPITRNAYKAYKIKKVIEELEAIGIERDLVGFPILTPPETFDMNDPDNADVATWAGDLITHIKRDEQEGAVVPFGWKLDLLGSPGKRQFDTDKIIDRWDKRIAMSMLGQFIMLGMDRTGSYALSDTQNDLFMLALVGWIESIAQTINRFAVEPLVRLNPEFDNLDILPTIEPVRPTPPNLNELSNYLFKLARAGLVVPDEELADFLRRLAFIKETPSSKDIRVVDPSSSKPAKPMVGDTGAVNANPLGSVNPQQPKANTAGSGGAAGGGN